MLPLPNQKLYKELSDLQVIDQKKLDLSLRETEKNNTFLGDVLLDKDLISRADLTRIVAELLGVPPINLIDTNPKIQAVSMIPENFATQNSMLGFKIEDKILHVATSNLNNIQALHFIEKKNDVAIKLYFALKQDIAEQMHLYAKDIVTACKQILAQNKEEPPIVQLVDTIIRYAYTDKTSDIHIEPNDNNCLIRFRIDGILHDMVILPKKVHESIVLRIKILANMPTDTHQETLDGKIQVQLENEELDLRVSIAPVTDGEKIVMRLLSDKARQFSLNDLGFAKRDLKIIEKNYKKSSGMILATGPTGSGKTTTLYSILKLINARDINIMTIEDPVEYEIDGVNQIQVNNKTNITFAKGLRSIVRQDPDVVLVGEIRDEETADIAINSAMTGHMVFSTLHTNDAATTFPRLIDMKVEPYLISSTVSVIIAQRLVRKLCVSCRYSVPINKHPDIKNVSDEIKKEYFSNTKQLYLSKGCPVCKQTGYQGRIGIYEVLEVSEPVRKAITELKNASEIKEIAIKNGMTPMVADGIEKIKQGITTLDEVLRTTSENAL